MTRAECFAAGLMVGALVMPAVSVAYHLIRYHALINPT